jgi:hypothetical protein
MWNWLKPKASKSDVTSFAAVSRGQLQRKCACGQHTTGGAECDDCKKKNESSIQRRASSAGPAAVPPIVDEVLRSPGQPLDTGTRAFFEPRFGRDFSQVRTHRDPQAGESAKAVNAHAYTVGNQIVFGPSQPKPETETGRRLMAHELAHVMQQGGTQDGTDGPTRISDPAEQSERQAEAAGDQVMREATPSELFAPSDGVLQRDAADRKSSGKPGGGKGEVEVRLAFEGKCPHPEKIAEAIPGARTMLATAENWFINYPFLDPAQQQFFDSIMQAHFGSNSSAARGRVHSRIIRMARIMDAAMNGGVTFDCGTGKPDKCNEGPYSMFVRRKERNTIHVCPDYFKAGLDERRFLLIHESAHMAGALVDHYLVQAGPIGKAECLAPSGLGSGEALNNADSYAWAVMCLTRKDAFTLIPGMSIHGKKP